VIILTIFAVGSATYVGVRYVMPFGLIAGILAGTAALGILCGAVLYAALWFDNRSGASSMMVHSWQFLSGVTSPAEVVNVNENECTFHSLPAPLFIVVWLVGLVFVIANAFLGLFVIIAMPIGIIGSIWWALSTLATRKIEFIQTSLLLLVIPLAAMILFGVDLRIIHIWTNWQNGC
jgi:hypothetical protein